ncbi:MAG: hypothetical protein HY586_07955, partial [Candidatus Omnitrophica bacterium]|nr:hypothetical protein [Candidatus Omnitrophota bacterium]
KELMMPERLGSTLEQSAETVDLPKVTVTGDSLATPAQFTEFMLRLATEGTAGLLRQRGERYLPDAVLATLNRRLRERLARGGRGGIQLEAMDPLPDGGSRFLFEVEGPRAPFWIRTSAKPNVPTSLSAPSPALANSLGAKKVLTREPVKLAINLGAPDYEVLHDMDSSSPTYGSGSDIQKRVPLRSNFDTKRNLTHLTEHNRILDAFLRSLVGDPNIQLTDIFGVGDPNRLYQYIRGNTHHGKFPGEVKYVIQNGQHKLFINGREIRLHMEVVSAALLEITGIEALVDMTDLRNTGGTQETQQQRLNRLWQSRPLKRIFVVNPNEDPRKGTLAVVPGLNDKAALAREGQVIQYVATPVTQGAALVIQTLADSDLGSQINYIAKVTERGPTEQGDRELHFKTGHGIGSAIYGFFPQYTPNTVVSTADGGRQLREVERPADIFDAPIKGAALLDVILELDEDAPILKAFKLHLKEVKRRQDAKELLDEDEVKEAIKQFYTRINRYFEGAAKEKLAGILRYGAKSEQLNSLYLAGEEALVVLDEDRTNISSGGQLSLTFWVNDLGQGAHLASLVSSAASIDQKPTEAELAGLNQSFNPEQGRPDTNVIPETRKKRFRNFTEGNKKVRFGIQGGRGRIGKGLLRLLYDNPNYELVFLNGVADLKTLVQQLKVDEVHGPYPFIPEALEETIEVRKTVPGTEEEKIEKITSKYLLLRDKETGEIRYKIPAYDVRQKGKDEKAIEAFEEDLVDKIQRLDVEVVFNATGGDMHRATSLNHALAKAGVKRVVLTAPIKLPKEMKKEEWQTTTVVYGINEAEIKKELDEARRRNTAAFISAASCTTNGIGPAVNESLIHLALDVEENRLSLVDIFFVTEHGFTPSQGSLFGAPKAGKELRTASGPDVYAAPEKTGANKAFVLAAPRLKGKMEGESRRVANADGSLVWSSFRLKLNQNGQLPTVEEVNAFFKELAEQKFPGIFGYDVITNTSQLLGRPESSIFDPSQTRVEVGPGGEIATITIGQWYDNEMGYTHRVVDVDEYAAMVERGIDPEAGKEKPVPGLTAVKLPGQPYLLPGSEEIGRILENIKARQRNLIRPQDLKPVLSPLDRLEPAYLSKDEKKNLEFWKEFLKAKFENGGTAKPFTSLHHVGRVIQQIAMYQVAGEASSFVDDKGNHYFLIPEYDPETQILNVYIPEKFWAKIESNREYPNAALQLLLLGFLQEAVGVSYVEALFVLGSYNSEQRQREAGGEVILPDLFCFLLSEMRERVLSAWDELARKYLNSLLQSHIDFKLSRDVLEKLLRQNRTDEEIAALKNHLTLMALQINSFIQAPFNAGDVSSSKSLSTKKFRRDLLQPTDPDPQAVEDGENRSRIAALGAVLPLVLGGFRGVGRHVTDREALGKLASLLAGKGVREALGQLMGTSILTSLGGSVRTRIQLEPGTEIVCPEGAGKTFFLINPLEGADNLFEDEPGADVVAINSEHEAALGGKFPRMYVNAFLGSFNGLNDEERMAAREALRQNPMDPDAESVELVKRWAGINKRSSMANVVVHILDTKGGRRHEAERIAQLEAFAKTEEGRGLEIVRIPYGTLRHAQQAVWGDAGIMEKLHIFLSTSGAAEVLTPMILAGRQTSYGTFRLMSRAGLYNAENVRPENAYKFSSEEQDEIKRLRPEDWEYLIPQSGETRPQKLFTLEDIRGNYEAAIISITPNPFFDSPGIEKTREATYQIPIVRIKRTGPDELFRWVEVLQVTVDAVGGMSWGVISSEPPKQVEGSSLGRARELLRGQGRGLEAVLGTIKQLSGGVAGNELGALRLAIVSSVLGTEAYAQEIESIEETRKAHDAYVRGLSAGLYRNTYGVRAGFSVVALSLENVSGPALERRVISNPHSVTIIAVPSRKLQEVQNQLRRKFGRQMNRVLLAPIVGGNAGKAIEKALAGAELIHTARSLKPEMTRTFLERHTTIFAPVGVLEEVRSFGLASRLVAGDAQGVLARKLNEAGIHPAQFNQLGNTMAARMAQTGGFDGLEEELKSGWTRSRFNHWIYVDDANALAAASEQLSRDLAQFLAIAKAA